MLRRIFGPRRDEVTGEWRRLHNEELNDLYSSPIRATCPAHLILLDFITRTVLGEQYRSFSSSLCNLLHSPVTSSLLGPNIPLDTIFSNTLSSSILKYGTNPHGVISQKDNMLVTTATKISNLAMPPCFHEPTSH